jgi:hypothetical protein
VKTTYVLNTIKIPTHEVDLKHHMVGFEERSKNRQWSRRKVERECRKKKSEEKERGVVFRELSSHVDLIGATDTTWQHLGQRGDRARHSPLNRWIDATQKC